MSDEMQVRVVTVEFLRPGPPHNQLLSPLTQYLAICNNSGAGVVTVPWEHAEFERRLRLLRYDAGDPDERRPVLHEIGQQMGNILGAVPGLPGALTVDPHQLGTMVQLRLTLSASELAMLPFELAKVPAARTSAADAWLALQARPPVCITRNVRTVSPEGVVWPDRPRILFVAGDPGSVPYEDHKRALLEAIEPFQYPGRDELREDGGRATAGELLTVLVNPTLNDVLREFRAQPYTHLHILAHGDVEGQEFGLAMRGVDDSVDVVSGERLASAITSVTQGGIHRPSVVTFASCDSGNVGSVILPGADLAHALHQAGVPLVVAAQFPLSMEGSVPLASTLYQGLLWGAHPLVLLQQLRSELHARYTTTFHDWASLVVYEALPRPLEDQLDSLRYRQAKRAMDAALQRVDLAVAGRGSGSALADGVRAAESAIGRLPLAGRYAVECLGLRASAGKRLAQAAHALAGSSTREPGGWKGDPYDLLDKARRDYEEAERRFVMNEAQPLQRVATLHWVAVQAVALAVVLGRTVDERAEGAWQVARLAADLYGNHPDVEERAWAHASLAELWMLRLGMPGLTDETRERCREKAIRHAQEIVRIYPDRDAFPVTSTSRQVQRYLDWWGAAAFAQGLASRGAERLPWDGELGLLSTARQLVDVLGRWQPEPAAAPTTAPPASAGSPRATASPRAGRLMRGAPGKAAKKAGQFFTIEMIPAEHGDSLWIEYGDARATHRVLVDCGTEGTADSLLQKVEALPKERVFELFVMTHVDADHIGGALPFFRAVRAGLTFGDVWFNGWRQLSGTLGPLQGEMFTTAIEDFRLVWNGWQDGGPIAVRGGPLPEHELPGGLRLTLLSPTTIQLGKLAPVWARELRRSGLEPGTRVDYGKFLRGTPSTSTDVDRLADSPFRADAAPANGSSIALLAEFAGASVLLGGDAHAPVLADSVRKLLASRGAPRLALDAFKVPHHASQNNLSRELVELVGCRRWLVSTNGNHFCHPDREAIARVIKYSAERPTLCFNYRTRFNEVWDRADLQEKHRYAAQYPPEGKVGLKTSLLES